MISQSHYWKTELLRISQKINKRLGPKRIWTVSQRGSFEKEIMIGFYIARKLRESNKLPDSLFSSPVRVHKFPIAGKNVTLMNNHRLDELYKLSNPVIEQYSLIYIINQIIHSYIFTPAFNPTEKNKHELLSILFISEKDRNKFLIGLDFRKIIKIFNNIGNSDVNHIIQKYNPKRKDYDVFLSNETRPLSDEVLKFIEEPQKKTKNI